jgi:hypothetical protein
MQSSAVAAPNYQNLNVRIGKQNKEKSEKLLDVSCV